MRFGYVLRVVLGLAGALASGASPAIDTAVSAQSLPNPFRMVDGWAQLPNGRQMGAVGKVAIDPDGRPRKNMRSRKDSSDATGLLAEPRGIRQTDPQRHLFILRHR